MPAPEAIWNDEAALTRYFMDESIPWSANAGIVIASVLVSVLGSYATLLLLSRRTSTKGTLNVLWLLLAATTFGVVAVWAMHFVSMLGIRLHPSPRYSWFIRFTPGFTALSLSVPTMAFMVAFIFLGSQVEFVLWRVPLTGILVGGTIALMHYSASFQLPTFSTSYSAYTVVLAIFVACVAATSALFVFFRLRSLWQDNFWKRCAASILLATAVLGMHYIGIAGTDWTFRREASIANLRGGQSQSTRLTIAISVMCLVIVLLSLGLGVLDVINRRRTVHEARQIVIASAAFDKFGRVLVRLDGSLPLEVIETEAVFRDLVEELHPRKATFQWLFSLSFDWATVHAFLPLIAASITSRRAGGGSGKSNGIRLGRRRTALKGKNSVKLSSFIKKDSKTSTTAGGADGTAVGPDGVLLPSSSSPATPGANAAATSNTSNAPATSSAIANAPRSFYGRNGTRAAAARAHARRAQELRVFRGRFVEAAYELASGLEVPLEDVGVLFDQTLITGTAVDPHRAEREKRDRAAAEAVARGLNPEKAAEMALTAPAANEPITPPLQEGVMLIVVRELTDERWLARHLASGYRLADIKHFSPVFAERVGVPKHEMDNFLLACKTFSKRGTRPVVQPGGAYVGLFGVRPTLGAKEGCGVEVLTYGFARHQIPAYRLPGVICPLVPESRNWLRSIAGLTLTEILQRCDDEISRPRSATRAYAEDPSRRQLPPGADAVAHRRQRSSVDGGSKAGHGQVRYTDEDVNGGSQRSSSPDVSDEGGEYYYDDEDYDVDDESSPLLDFQIALSITIEALAAAMKPTWPAIETIARLSPEILNVPSSDDDTSEPAQMIILEAILPSVTIPESEPAVASADAAPVSIKGKGDASVLPTSVSASSRPRLLSVIDKPPAPFTFTPFALFSSAQTMLIRGQGAHDFGREVIDQLCKDYDFTPDPSTLPPPRPTSPAHPYASAPPPRPSLIPPRPVSAGGVGDDLRPPQMTERTSSLQPTSGAGLSSRPASDVGAFAIPKRTSSIEPVARAGSLPDRSRDPRNGMIGPTFGRVSASDGWHLRAMRDLELCPQGGDLLGVEW